MLRLFQLPFKHLGYFVPSKAACKESWRKDREGVNVEERAEKGKSALRRGRDLPSVHPTL